VPENNNGNPVDIRFWLGVKLVSRVQNSSGNYSTESHPVILIYRAWHRTPSDPVRTLVHCFFKITFQYRPAGIESVTYYKMPQHLCVFCGRAGVWLLYRPLPSPAAHVPNGEHCEIFTASSISPKYNQQDATFSRSIYFYKSLYMLQAVPPPIIRNIKLYIQRQVLSNQYCCLLLSWMRWNSVPSHPGSSIGLSIPDAVCTVLCPWWWAEEPPETCRTIYRNKYE
jgi:hypothetical protein